MSFRTLASICLLAAAIPASAQSPTSGSLSGRITDSSGGVIPGVAVKLSGPALQGVRTAVTDPEGIYRFPDVPPGGDYKIEAARQGLQTVSQAGFQVFLGQEATIDLVLAPATVSQQIIVTPTSPLLDLTVTTTGVHITTSQFLSLPTTRSFQQLTALAPGVSLEMGDHDRRLASSPTVGASSAPENNYLIDGLSTTDPRYGISGANLTINFLQGVQVLTAGYQAEYGRSTGALFNVITKSGGNVFQGDLFSYFRGKAFSPASVERSRNRELVTFADRATDFDAGASLGGPLVKDRLWFFGAVDPARQTTYLGGQLLTGVAVNTGERQYDGRADAYAAKVTWAVSRSQSFVLSAFGDPSRRTGWLAAPNADPSAAYRVEKAGGHNVSAKYGVMLSSTSYLEVTAGRHEQRAILDPATERGRTVPHQVDETLGGFEHGGFQRDQNDRATRTSFGAKITHTVGTHDLRYGFDAELNDYDANLHETWYRFFGPSFGFGTFVEERNYAVTGGGGTTNAAAYAQDSWRVRPNLRVNVGLRVERQRLTSDNRVEIAGPSDAVACTFTGTCRTVDGFVLGGKLAPRAGFVWVPTHRGLSKVSAFWGRFYEAIPLDLNIRAINGEQNIVTQYVNAATLTSDNWYNPNGSPLAIHTPWIVNRVSTVNARTPLDETLKTQFEDQFVVGWEYQLRGVWSVGARYVDRSLKRIVEGIGTFTNPADPLALTGFVISNPGQGVFGAPFDKPQRHYRAIEVTVQKALAHQWHLMSSFVYARSTGNHEGLYQSGNSQLDPNITALYDIPSFVPNALGRLRADKPYQVKVHSAYTTKWGLTISEGLIASAGVPISTLGTEIVHGYGDGTIFMLPRGSSGRTPGYWTFDAHADYKLPVSFGPHRSLSVVVDVFNLFNRHTVLEVDQNFIYQGMPNFDLWINGLPGGEPGENLDVFGNPKYDAGLPHSPYFKTPILFQAPRSMQFAVRLTF
jgi:outer membrane receptor protein involved in Fe transport